MSSKSRSNNFQIGFWRKTLGKIIIYLSEQIVGYQPQEMHLFGSEGTK